MEKLIDSISLPEDLRALTAASLQRVADELREELIDCVSSSGGHFASSLGAAEISVAVHSSFNTPEDRVIWDVGHQGYIHKMLTGRRAQLHTIRKRGGLSGYLQRKESQFDPFGAGHAGTSISAAVGMASALRNCSPPRHVVAIMGDGAMTCGMAFEALNHAGALKLPNLIVVLNDNGMSISPNVGAISWLFSRAVTCRASNLARSGFKALYRRGYVPELVYKAIDRAEEATQGFFSTPALLFEGFGWRYIGPLDGHDIPDLLTAFEHAKNQDVPVLIHTRTVKGKGYSPAEDDPINWHATSPFNRRNGNRPRTTIAERETPTYSEIFGDAMVEIARRDSRVCAVTAAMAGGTGLAKLEAELPGAFYDVGICEEHAVTFAAGLACEGLRPVCAIYSTFLQRSFDQILHDVCIQNLPVVFAMDRSGAVGDDGETHQGLFDISYLRCIPNITLMAPANEQELRDMLYTALKQPGPVALRYPRGKGIGLKLRPDFEEVPIGKAVIVREGRDALLLCYGPIVNEAIAAAEDLARKHGIEATVVNSRFAKPLDHQLLLSELPRYPLVCTIEDHALIGGFGSAIAELINDEGIRLAQPLRRFGAPDNFVAHASQSEQHHLCGYDAESISLFLKSACRPRKIAAAG